MFQPLEGKCDGTSGITFTRSLLARQLSLTRLRVLNSLLPNRMLARSLVATGYTNHYPMNPPRTWCTGCPNITIPYSINLGQLITIAPDQPRTSLDIILAPTQHQSAPGLLTIQIPRYLLDSKNPSGADTPFRVTLDGHGLSWGQIQSTDTYRVLALYFTSQNGFLQIFGNTGAVTKAFPTNH